MANWRLPPPYSSTGAAQVLGHTQEAPGSCHPAQSMVTERHVPSVMLPLLEGMLTVGQALYQAPQIHCSSNSHNSTRGVLYLHFTDKNTEVRRS